LGFFEMLRVPRIDCVRLVLLKGVTLLGKACIERGFLRLLHRLQLGLDGLPALLRLGDLRLRGLQGFRALVRARCCLKRIRTNMLGTMSI
jgi:hypothetical protein